MKKFKVPFKEIVRFDITVTEAESMVEAIEVAKDMYIMDDYFALNIDKQVFVKDERLI